MTQTTTRPAAPPPPPSPTPPSAPAAPEETVAPPAPRRRWSRSTRISVAVWVVVVLLQVAAVAGYYAVYSGPYVTTINAQVDGHQMQINAPVDGTLIRWDVGPGSFMRAGQAIGRIRQDGTGFSAPEKVIRAPEDGQVAMAMAEEGQRVTTGTTLALAFADGGIYVTARVPTTLIAQVRLGAPVDLLVAGRTVGGVVGEIQASTAGQFDIYPSPDQNTTNPQKVKEWVPVKVMFNQADSAVMLPGLNVTARIHRS